VFDYFKDGFWHGIAYWIYHFQTLVAGIFALLAAWWTVINIQKQIKQAEEFRNEDKHTKNIASRAGMARALSVIADYNNSCMNLAIELYQHYKNNNNHVRGFTGELIDYPQESYDKIQSVVEYADREDAKILLDYISFSQIQESRMRELANLANVTPRRIITEWNCYSYIYDALRAKKATDRLFDYARNQIDNIGDYCSADDALNTLFVGWSEVIEGDNELIEYIRGKWPPKPISESETH